MRLRPIVPYDPIEDLTDDANRHYSDPDAIDDQTLFNDNLSEFERPTPIEITNEIEINETETIDSEHGTIYYERKQVREVPSPPNFSPENIRTENTQHTEYEIPSDTVATPPLVTESEQNALLNDDATSTTSSTETPVPITHNNTTRYSLREAPIPRTYNNLLVHELQAKPALLKFMERKSTSQ